MTTATALQKEARLLELQRLGMGRHQGAMETLDHIKGQLCPKNGECPPLDEQLRLFRELNASMEQLPEDHRLKIMGVPDSSHTRLVVGVKVPDPELREYFECQDANPDQPDPLGAKSLIGIMSHYGVQNVGFAGPMENKPSTWINPRRPYYQRGFRVSDGVNQRLRKAIDRALWMGEHVYLDDELAYAFAAIHPKRQDYLTELGLIVMPDDEGRMEIFVPEVNGNHQRAAFERLLTRLAKSVEARLKRDRMPLTLRPDSPAEKERQVFDLIDEESLLENPRFLGLLRDRQIDFKADLGPRGRLRQVTFFSPDMDMQRIIRNVTRADFPPELWNLVMQVKNLKQDRAVPNRADFCMFLAIPEVVEFLRKEGISFIPPALNADGTFAEQAYFYAENLLNFDPNALTIPRSVAPSLPPHLQTLGTPRAIPAHRRNRFLS